MNLSSCVWPCGCHCFTRVCCRPGYGWSNPPGPGGQAGQENPYWQGLINNMRPGLGHQVVHNAGWVAPTPTFTPTHNFVHPGYFYGQHTNLPSVVPATPTNSYWHGGYSLPNDNTQEAAQNALTDHSHEGPQDHSVGGLGGQSGESVTGHGISEQSSVCETVTTTTQATVATATVTTTSDSQTMSSGKKLTLWEKYLEKKNGQESQRSEEPAQTGSVGAEQGGENGGSDRSLMSAENSTQQPQGTYDALLQQCPLVFSFSLCNEV